MERVLLSKLNICNIICINNLLSNLTFIYLKTVSFSSAQIKIRQLLYLFVQNKWTFFKDSHDSYSGIHLILFACSSCGFDTNLNKVRQRLARQQLELIVHLILFSSSKVILIFIRSPSWCSVAKSCLTLWPYGLQHARLLCPSLSPGVCSDSCPLSQWCQPTISSSVVSFFLLPSIFPSIRVLSNKSALHITRPKYWSFSFSISPGNEYSELISFRIDWFDALAVQGTLKNI